MPMSQHSRTLHQRAHGRHRRARRRPEDFSAWIEVYLDGAWRTFDPRNNIPRIGRIVVARGRDAADIPLIMSFGLHLLKSFRVWTYEVFDALGDAPASPCESVRNIDPPDKAAASIDFVPIARISRGSRFARNETPSGAFIFPRNQGLSLEKGWVRIGV
jgi:hypothetical protein